LEIVIYENLTEHIEGPANHQGSIQTSTITSSAFKWSPTILLVIRSPRITEGKLTFKNTNILNLMADLLVEFKNLKLFNKNELIDEEDKDKVHAQLQNDAEQIAADCREMLSNEAGGNFDSTTLPEQRKKECTEGSNA
jgi:hypothetical protein